MFQGKSDTSRQSTSFLSFFFTGASGGNIFFPFRRAKKHSHSGVCHKFEKVFFRLLGLVKLIVCRFSGP